MVWIVVAGGPSIASGVPGAPAARAKQASDSHAATRRPRQNPRWIPRVMSDTDVIATERKSTQRLLNEVLSQEPSRQSKQQSGEPPWLPAVTTTRGGRSR